MYIINIKNNWLNLLIFIYMFYSAAVGPNNIISVIAK
jgi:hypothetical protein